jgi:hypothetical protein
VPPPAASDDSAGVSRQRECLRESFRSHFGMAGARITRYDVDFEAAPWCTGGASCAPSPSPTVPSRISGFTFGLFHRFKLVYTANITSACLAFALSCPPSFGTVGL